MSSLLQTEILCCVEEEKDNLASCKHKEADTILFVHVGNFVEIMHNVWMIKASDTDVFVIAISVYHMP